MKNAPVPVLVFGSSLTGVGVIRALGRAGIPAYSLCAPGELMVRSRWYRGPQKLGVDRQPTPAGLPYWLNALRLPRAVLIPCSDDWVEAVAALPDDLKARFPASSASSEVMEVCVDKWRFAEMLRMEGCPHPKTALLNSLDEMAALNDSCYQNMFLKPRGSLDFGRRHGVKAFLIKNKSDAMAVMSRDQNGHSDFPIMLQEYIPGPPSHHFFVDGFVDASGKIRALFARQRLRMYPPLLGNSTLMETVPLSDVKGAIDTIEKISSALRYRGIFSAEFKYDDRDGLFKILEVNARPWWFIEFAVRCGIDVCTMSYRDALGLPVESVLNYDAGRRCVYVPNEVKAYRMDPQRGALLPWLRSWLFAEKAIFAWDDPMPAFTGVRKFMKHHFGRA